MFKKPCRRCEELFRPTGKSCKLCDNCKKRKGIGTKHERIEESLNYDLFKQGYYDYRDSMRKMALALVRSCPRDILVETLKKKKIIKQDWNQKREVYIERKTKKNN